MTTAIRPCQHPPSRGQPSGSMNRRTQTSPSRHRRSRLRRDRFVRRSDTDDIKVWIDGRQYADGRVERDILVNQLRPDWPLTPAQAPDVIAALIGVVEEVRQMANRDVATA
jgi:hypothetical protein